MLKVGDLAIVTFNPDYGADEDFEEYDGRIVEIVEVEEMEPYYYVSVMGESGVEFYAYTDELSKLNEGEADEDEQITG